MVELIFTIVIIAILAIIAIPKMNATRYDAKVSAELRNLEVCITDLASQYTAVGIESLDSGACKNLSCSEVLLGDKKNDGNVTISFIHSDNTPNYCQEVEDEALKRGMSGNIYFGGRRVVINN